MVRNSIIKKVFKSQIWCESGSGAPTHTCRAHAFHHYDLLENGWCPLIVVLRPLMLVPR